MGKEEEKRERWEKGKDGLEELVNKVIGCCVRVHMELGPGFLETAYQRALAIELQEQAVPFESEKEIELAYHGQSVGTHRLDVFVDDQLVVELKAVDKLGGRHYAQVRSYLRATNTDVGLLVNFAASKLDVRRVELR